MCPHCLFFNIIIIIFEKKKKKHNYMQIYIRKQQCRKHLQNLNAAQTIPRTPNQKVDRNMLSAIKDVDPPMEI